MAAVRRKRQAELQSVGRWKRGRDRCERRARGQVHKNDCAVRALACDEVSGWIGDREKLAVALIAGDHSLECRSASIPHVEVSVRSLDQQTRSGIADEE